LDLSATSHAEIQVMHLGQEDSRRDAPSQFVVSGGTCPFTGDVHFDHLIAVVTAWFLHLKVTVFPYLGRYFEIM